MWLGGLFTPEAYLTATRQCVAQSLHVSLEELTMHVQMFDQPSQVNSNKENTFLITGKFYFSCNSINTNWYILGLKLQGARCRNNALFYSSSIMDDIPVLAVEWKKSNSTISSSKTSDQQEVTLPVYGNGLRTELLCTINVKAGQENASEFNFYERGVAVLASVLE